MLELIEVSLDVSPPGDPELRLLPGVQPVLPDAYILPEATGRPGGNLRVGAVLLTYVKDSSSLSPQF